MVENPIYPQVVYENVTVQILRSRRDSRELGLVHVKRPRSTRYIEDLFGLCYLLGYSFMPRAIEGGQLVVEYATLCFRSQEDCGPLVGSRPTRLSSAALQTSPARPSVTNKAK